MVRIRVGLGNGKGTTISILRPFDYITTDDIKERLGNVRIIGWCKAGPEIYRCREPARIEDKLELLKERNYKTGEDPKRLREELKEERNHHRLRERHGKKTFNGRDSNV